MTHKEKILTFVKTTGLNKTQFCKKCGLSNGYLDTKGAITSDKLALILENFKNLNLDWLILDEGDMVIPEVSDVNEPRGVYGVEEECKKCDSLHHIIDKQQDHIDSLKGTIETLTLCLDLKKPSKSH